MNMEYLQYEPYTVKVKRHHWFFGLPHIVSITLVFEDTPIRELGNLDTAQELASLMNTAWHLGYGSGYTRGELSKDTTNVTALVKAV